MTLHIRRAAVLGAGTMGAQIAAHFANAGLPVLLLDVTPQAAREGLERAKALRPDPFFVPDAAALIRTAGFDDGLAAIGRYVPYLARAGRGSPSGSSSCIRGFSSRAGLAFRPTATKTAPTTLRLQPLCSPRETKPVRLRPIDGTTSTPARIIVKGFANPSALVRLRTVARG